MAPNLEDPQYIEIVKRLIDIDSNLKPCDIREGQQTELTRLVNNLIKTLEKKKKLNRKKENNSCYLDLWKL